MSMEFAIIFSVIISIGFIFFAVRYGKMRQAPLKDMADGLLPVLENDAIQLAPSLKNSLIGYSQSIHDISHIQNMSANELKQLLSTVSAAVKVFENRINAIYQTLGQLDDHAAVVGLKIQDFLTNSDSDRKYGYSSLYKRLIQEIYRTDEVFANHLNDIKILDIIPDMYRSSIILDKMCGYLSTGEEDNWRGCIKTVKDDMHKMRIEGKLDEQIRIAEEMNDKLAKIESHTRAIRHYTAIVAWNTM